MASGQTTNYGLNQWEPGDKVLREEFNGDNQKIDAALRTIPRIVTGTYTGDGADSRFIELGFTPKAVYVCENNGRTYDSGTIYGGLAVSGSPLVETYGSQSCTGLEITAGGFTAYRVSINYRSGATNLDKKVYHYIAFG